MSRLIDADELKKHKYHSDITHENVVSVAQIDWMPTVQAVPIDKIKTLINVIEDFRKNPVIDNDDVDLFIYDVLFALNRLIEGNDPE